VAVRRPARACAVDETSHGLPRHEPGQVVEILAENMFQGRSFDQAESVRPPSSGELHELSGRPSVSRRYTESERIRSPRTISALPYIQ